MGGWLVGARSIFSGEHPSLKQLHGRGLRDSRSDTHACIGSCHTLISFFLIRIGSLIEPRLLPLIRWHHYWRKGLPTDAMRCDQTPKQDENPLCYVKGEDRIIQNKGWILQLLNVWPINEQSRVVESNYIFIWIEMTSEVPRQSLIIVSVVTCPVLAAGWPEHCWSTAGKVILIWCSWLEARTRYQEDQQGKDRDRAGKLKGKKGENGKGER